MRVAVAERQLAVADRLDRTDGDLADDGPAAGEVPTIAFPVAHLDDRPTLRLTAGGIDLQVAVGVVFMISQDHPRPRVETEVQVGVDDAALGRDWIDHFPRLHGDRQLQFLARRVDPMHEVGGLRIRQVVVRRAIGRIAPDPAQMEHAVRAQQRSRAVGVHLALAVGQRCRQQARPLLRRLVVGVIKVISAAALPVAITEDEPPRLILQEDRIRHPLLALADHRRRSQRRDIACLRRAEIHQRHHVHVARHMKLARAIQGERHVVMRIPGDRRRELLVDPLLLVEPTLGHRQLALGVVVSDVLMGRGRQQGEIDWVARPDLVHRQDIGHGWSRLPQAKGAQEG